MAAHKEYSLRLLTLPARPDRPMSIPLPKNKMTRLGRNNVAATDPQIVTFMLNTEEYSHNRDLLSRTHCELWFNDRGKLMIRDGGTSAETGVSKPSVNGTSIQGILLPFGAERELREGYEVELGTPQIVPGRRDDTPRPNEFVYRVEAEVPTGFGGGGGGGKKKEKVKGEVKLEAPVPVKRDGPSLDLGDDAPAPPPKRARGAERNGPPPKPPALPEADPAAAGRWAGAAAAAGAQAKGKQPKRRRGAAASPDDAAADAAPQYRSMAAAPDAGAAAAAAPVLPQVPAPVGQCDKHPHCVRGFKHGGRGGRCKIRPPPPADEASSASTASTASASSSSNSGAGSSAADGHGVRRPYHLNRGAPAAAPPAAAQDPAAAAAAAEATRKKEAAARAGVGSTALEKRRKMLAAAGGAAPRIPQPEAAAPAAPGRGKEKAPVADSKTAEAVAAASAAGAMAAAAVAGAAGPSGAAGASAWATLRSAALDASRADGRLKGGSCSVGLKGFVNEVLKGATHERAEGDDEPPGDDERDAARVAAARPAQLLFTLGRLGLVPPAELQEGPLLVMFNRCDAAGLAAEPTTDPEYLDAAAALRAFEAAWDGRRANIPQQLSLGHRAVCAALEHCARAAGDAGEGSALQLQLLCGLASRALPPLARRAAPAGVTTAAGIRAALAAFSDGGAGGGAAQAAAAAGGASSQDPGATQDSEAGEPASAADDGDAAVCAGARALAIDLLVLARACGPQGCVEEEAEGWAAQVAPSALCTLYEALWDAGHRPSAAAAPGAFAARLSGGGGGSSGEKRPVLSEAHGLLKSLLLLRLRDSRRYERAAGAAGVSRGSSDACALVSAEAPRLFWLKPARALAAPAAAAAWFELCALLALLLRLLASRGLRGGCDDADAICTGVERFREAYDEALSRMSEAERTSAAAAAAERDLNALVVYADMALRAPSSEVPTPVFAVTGSGGPSSVPAN